MLPMWYLVPGGILATIALAGNGTVIYLIITRKRLHTTANWFVLSLTIADFCVGAGYFVADYLCDALECSPNLSYSIVSFLAAASATNLCAMTLDRYIAIVKPLKYVTFMTRRAAVLTLIPWIVSFVPHFVFLLRFVIFTTDTSSEGDQREFLLFDFVVFEILPIVVLLVVMGHIIIIARRHSRQMAVLMVQLRFNQRIKEDGTKFASLGRVSSSVHVVVAAVAVFVACYALEVCYTIIYQFPQRNPHEIFYCIMELMYHVNSAFNPVVYAFFKHDIKEGLKSLFRCGRKTVLLHYPSKVTSKRKNGYVSNA